MPRKRIAASDVIVASNPSSETKQEVDIESAPLEQVVMRLVFEVTLERVRHRALLSYLEEKIGFKFEDYEEEFHRIEGRDASALFARIMLPETNFFEMFASWIEDDRKRYIKRKATKAGKPADG